MFKNINGELVASRKRNEFILESDGGLKFRLKKLSGNLLMGTGDRVRLFISGVDNIYHCRRDSYMGGESFVGVVHIN